VVGKQSEIGAINIGPEMYDDPYNKALPFIWRVVALSLVVASGYIGDNILFAFLIKLAKNSSNTKSTQVNV